ncbi:MAG TPA: hypothetical protein PLS20_08585 [Ruminococcus flavefaciens]|nr:hypothetical protein [Ruminococcus flavefaciens]
MHTQSHSSNSVQEYGKRYEQSIVHTRAEGSISRPPEKGGQKTSKHGIDALQIEI